MYSCDKIKGWIAQHGTDDSVNKMVTDILGLTQGNETISSRALAVEAPEATTRFTRSIFCRTAKAISASTFIKTKPRSTGPT